MFRGHKPRTTAATTSTAFTKPAVPTDPGMLVFTKANGHHLLPLPCSCYRPAARATLQGLCRTGYAAHALTAALATQIGVLQLLHWPQRSACSKCCTGHTVSHAPSVALATQISMLKVLHWPHRSVCSTCRIGHADQHAPSVALATQISMLQVLHWPHRAANPNCCTGNTDQHAPIAKLATRISMFDMHCCSTLKRWSAHNVVAF